HEFLKSLNEHMRIEGRHIILLADNASSHPAPSTPPINYTGPMPSQLTNITLRYLPSNTSA
ncbi:hypothetical protein L211DRAFT_782102, partial [Terfezia boudieri ATCC MYA-4762]